ncbi:hypothetical protein HK405_005473, partial [Cladochytrium tenue]
TRTRCTALTDTWCKGRRPGRGSTPPARSTSRTRRPSFRSDANTASTSCLCPTRRTESSSS